jgi:hypothetical protein
VKFPVGTRVEIGFGPELPCDEYVLFWAKTACMLARFGTPYNGKSSPWWHDDANFYELLDYSGKLKVRDLITHLDVDDVDMIVANTGLQRAQCKDVTREQAAKLLKTAQMRATVIPPQALGAVGPEAFPGFDYACIHGGAGKIPFVVEAWALERAYESTLDVCVNRTPVAADIEVNRNGMKIMAFNCGLGHTIAKAPLDKHFDIWLNITTPHMPLLSNGKAPNLEPFIVQIKAAVGAAVSKARTPAPAPDDTLLPKRRRGRQSPEAEEIYRAKVVWFCALIQEIKLTMDFSVGSRGWCYLLEKHGLRKGDFDDGEKLITACRKSGELPIDICAEDISRETVGVEELDAFDVTGKVDSLVDQLLNHAHEGYLPISLWDDLDVYVEVATEKLDLRNLFEPVCRQAAGSDRGSLPATRCGRHPHHEREWNIADDEVLGFYGGYPGGLCSGDSLETIAREIWYDREVRAFVAFYVPCDASRLFPIRIRQGKTRSA